MMTKCLKKGIILITMKIIDTGYNNQQALPQCRVLSNNFLKMSCIFLIMLISFFSVSCNKNRDASIVPPSSPPLTRSVIGYGMLTESYTHILDQPNTEAVSLGYLREGSVVPVLERKIIEQNNKSESWVLVKGTYEGWLKEELIMIYENEAQAKTASELLN
jgi:hypothetical protein